MKICAVETVFINPKSPNRIVARGGIDVTRRVGVGELRHDRAVADS
jgi:hypothetical protein